MNAADWDAGPEPVIHKDIKFSTLKKKKKNQCDLPHETEKNPLVFKEESACCERGFAYIKATEKSTWSHCRLTWRRQTCTLDTV